MSKKKVAMLKLVIPGGKATPGGTLGPALGQKAIPMKAFCDKVNEETKMYNGKNLRIKVYTYDDKSFSYKIVGVEKNMSQLIKEKLKIEKGAGKAGKETVAKLTRKQVEEIAAEKQGDLNINDLNSACNLVIGTAKSMGIELEK